MGSARLDLADRLESAGQKEAAQQMRDYDAACEWTGTTATEAGREAGAIAAILDDLADLPTTAVPTLNWLMERAMVAIWKAAGSPATPQTPEGGRG